MTIQLSSEVERLVRLLATKTGKTLDDVVEEAIEERARAAGVPVGAGRRTPEEIERSLNEIVARVSSVTRSASATPTGCHGSRPRASVCACARR